MVAEVRVCGNLLITCVVSCSPFALCLKLFARQSGRWFHARTKSCAFWAVIVVEVVVVMIVNCAFCLFYRATDI